MLYHDSGTVVRAPLVTDRYGNQVRDWDSATRFPVTDIAVLPTQQVEDATGNRTSVTTGWRLYSRPGTDVDLRATDRVEFGALSLDVIGEVARWPHPLRPRAVHHVEAELRRVTG
jgi:hypothetical protein